MTEVLLPCPFCGGGGDIESQPSYSQAANTYERHRGWCNNCGFGLEWHSYETDAIAAWNHRTAGQAELVEAATGAIDDVRARYTGTYRSDDDIRFALNTARNAVAAALAPLSQSKGEGL